MKEQGFDQSAFSLFGLGNYPIASYIPPLLIMGGKKISELGSIYLITGQAASARVEGYNGTAEITIHYSVLQSTLGYQFSFRNSHIKLGIGPSLFVFRYYPDNNGESHSTVSEARAGRSFMMRVPFGEEKKLFGVELFFEMNVTAPVNVADTHLNVNYENYTLMGSSVSMVYAVLGLNLAFRR